MKKIIFIAVAAMLHTTIHAQPVQIKYITDWARSPFMFPPDYWEKTADELSSQIGVQEFEKVKQYAVKENMPCAMLIFCPGATHIKNLDTLNHKINALKVNRIARFHYPENQLNALLRITYKGNENWDPIAKWDTVYKIIIDELLDEVATAPGPPKDITNPDPPTVQVKSWKGLTFDYPREYWGPKTNALARQTGSTETSMISRFYTLIDKAPQEVVKPGGTTLKDAIAWHARLSSFTWKKMATWEEGGKEMAVLGAVYQQKNYNPDKDVRWPKVYVVLPVKQLKD